MTNSMNTPEIETLSYHSPLCKCPDCEKKEDKFDCPCPGCSAPQEAKESVECHNTMTSRECLGCVIDAVGECHLSNPEQPNTNAMIFEQANGSIKVTLELLEQLETKNTNEETQKHGCIWTLKGWHKNNLKHLQKAFE